MNYSGKLSVSQEDVATALDRILSRSLTHVGGGIGTLKLDSHISEDIPGLVGCLHGLADAIHNGKGEHMIPVTAPFVAITIMVMQELLVMRQETSSVDELERLYKLGETTK